MKLYLFDQDSYLLDALPLSPLWQEQAQAIADECAAFVTAVLGNEAGKFEPAPAARPKIHKPAPDAMAAVRAVSERVQACDAAAYQARIRQLEAEVAAHVAAMVEQEQHVTEYRRDLEAMRAAARHVLAQHGYSTPSLAALGKLLAREERE